MSLNKAAGLLQQYNKKSPYKGPTYINTTAANTGNKIGTLSYANMYDALYNKFSSYKNFNIDMWRDALKLGEQDQYLAFLERNKDTTLSNEFYDPQYYDYETMMLEMYLPFANKTNIDEPRTTETFDPATNEWVEQEIGKMSDYDYIQYQLTNARQLKNEQISTALIAERKAQMSWIKTFGHDLAAAAGEFGEGALSGLTGILDFVIAIGSAGIIPFLADGGESNYLDAFVNYFGENGLTALEKDTVRAALDNYERNYTHFRDASGNITGVGTYFAGVANSIGMMIPAIIANIATGGAALVGTGTFYTSIFSHNMYENANNSYIKDSPAAVKILNATVKTGVEAIIEYGLGEFMGGTIQNNLLGLRGTLGKIFADSFKWYTGAGYVAKSALQEGFEEFLQDFSTNCVDQFMGIWEEGYGNTGVTAQTLVDSFMCGVLSSLFMSGGHIGLIEAQSSLINRAAKKAGKYNTELDIGPGDMVIETESGDMQKLRGWNRLYYANILSDFKSAIKTLKDGDGDIKLAQEVYGGLSVLTQFYSSFDAERVKNCELLLTRVIDAERRKNSDAIVKHRTQTLAQAIEKTFTSMTDGAAFRYVQKKAIQKAIEKAAPKLEKDGVTTTTGAMNAEGEKYSADAKALEERLGKKAVDRLTELSKDFEWVFATDGHSADEEDGILFVSEAWLQNYTTSDIYKFLAQSQVLDTVITDNDLKPMLEKHLEFYREFSGQKDATLEDATMQLLFNKSVYQAFLLSNSGKNAHDFSKFIFHLHDIIKDYADISGHTTYRGKLSKKRVNLLNKIYEEIKTTMREPTLKAIINWGLNPQEIGAMSIFIDKNGKETKELEFINLYRQHKLALSQPLTGKQTSAYSEGVERIKAEGKFTDEEKAIIDRRNAPDATLEEKLLARALLDEADRRLTVYDFDVNVEAAQIHEAREKFDEFERNDTELLMIEGAENERKYLAIRQLYDTVALLNSSTDSLSNRLTEVILGLREKIRETYDEDISLLDFISKVKDELKRVQDTVDTYTDSRNIGTEAGLIEQAVDRIETILAELNLWVGDDVETILSRLRTNEDIAGFEYDVNALIDAFSNRFTFTMAGISEPLRIAKELLRLTEAELRQVEQTKPRVSGALTIPYQAILLDNPNDHSDAQFATDKLSEFAHTYGISARQMILGDLTGMSIAQRDILTRDMEALGVEDKNYVHFVILKLEQMLGDRFVVTPVTKQYSADAEANHYDDSTQIYDFAIAKKIPAQDLLPSELLDGSIKRRNEIFENMFEPPKMFGSMVKREAEHWLNDMSWLEHLASDVDGGIEGARDYLQAVIRYSDTLYTDLVEHFMQKKEILDPFIDEPLLKNVNDLGLIYTDKDISARAYFFGNLMRLYGDLATLSLADFVDLSIFSSEIVEDLKTVRVKFEPAGENAAGYWDAVRNEICIDPKQSHNYVNTFVHELNHALQHYLNLPNGFNSKVAAKMPDFLEYVLNNYGAYFEYALRREGHSLSMSDRNSLRRGKLDLNVLTSEQYKILADCAYMLIQGEIWARTHTHNENVNGFTVIQKVDGEYVLAPDGKTKFKVPTDSKSSSKQSAPKASPAVVESALYTTMKKVLAVRAQSREQSDVYNPFVRNTYHTALTQNDKPVIRALLRPEAMRWAIIHSPTINDLINDPSLLSDELLEIIGDDVSEGNVAAALRQYIEAEFPGISIDRSANTHRYVLVDDNAFDDLLLPSLQSMAEDLESTSLYEKYNSETGVALSNFYRSAELRRLGIGDNVKVVINPNVVSETRFEKGVEQGVIYINANGKTSNAKLIDVLNHEFRHLMQRYNLLETGFTPRFKVTNEMIADVKKHVPELFTDKELKDWAMIDAKNKKQSWEASIVQRFVYTLTGGELHAYGIDASLITGKTLYVSYEAGRPTIFMPWYDAKTGDGRHKTEFLAARADDDSAPISVNGKGISFRNMPQVEKKAKDTRPKSFTKKKAENTNLIYFIKKGQRNQLDPVMQDFVIATTGYEDRLPPELMKFIYNGTLTRGAFNKWFRKVKTIDDFTFKLINKYIFKNDYITSMKMLDDLLVYKPQIYWALNILLLKKGRHLESLLLENDLDKFMTSIEMAENTDFWNEVLELSKNFDNYPVEHGDETSYEHIGIDNDTMKYMRLYAMQWFNGSMAGAFKMANGFRKALFAREGERRGLRTTSLDQTLNDEHSDDKDMTKADMISEGDVENDALTHFGNDILAIYENQALDTEVTIDTILSYKYQYDVERLLASLDWPDKQKKILKARLEDIPRLQGEIEKLEKKTDRTEQEEKRLKGYVSAMRRYKQITKDRPAFRKALMAMSSAEIATRYMMILDAQAGDISINSAVFDLNKTFAHELSEDAKSKITEGKKSTARIDIVGRIKGRASTLMKQVREGEVKFDDLPQEVQAWFEYKLVEQNGKTRPVLDYVRNEEGTPVVYAVGKGRAKLPGETDPARYNYMPKHDITKGNEEFRHDTSQILENERILVATVEKIKSTTRQKKEADEAAKKSLKSVQRENAKLRRELKNAVKNAKRPENSTATDFEVTAKKKKTSDTPNNFQVISSIEMPDVLRNLLDVSFNEMADTRVQFASRDEAGNLYDKETMKPKDFASRVKHEVANWDAFYEAVRPQLLALTRDDVLNIVDFFERGFITLDGPANKLEAFEIYLLGYFIDAARTNAFNWDLSNAQIEYLETLFEKRASEVGSALNAVQQMKKVIDPLKRVRQRMFEDWITVSDTDTDNITALVDDLQNEKNAEARIKKAKALNEMFDAMQEREFEARTKSSLKFWTKDFWKKDNFSELYEEVKAFRYLAMLSSPITWIRNQISNVINFVLNKSADAVSNIIFTKKGYREEQWDLSKVKISEEAKQFIDEYIKDNPVFDSLYNMSTKYDERQRKKVAGERELFVNLVTSAIEQKYAAEHRFDRPTFNMISKWVNHLMSDAPFIKLVSSRYFGKMLTIEAKKGNVNLAEGLSNNALNLFAEAVILANQEYMHKRSFVADAIDKVRGKHPYVYEILHWSQPFINSSFNWFAETLKYTPFGLINAIHRMTKLEQQIDKMDKRRKDNREMVADSRVTEFLIRRDIGKGTVGLLFSILGMFLGLSGVLKIEDDDDKFYAIAGDVKVDISNIFASSSVLIGASIVQRWVKQADGEGMSLDEVLDLTAGYLLDGFFLNDILERHQWDTGIYDGMLTETESVLRSFVPQIWQLGIRVFNNDKIRYSAGMKGVWERWLNSFAPGQPGGNRVVDPYTGEVQSKYALPIVGELLKSGMFGPKIYWYTPSDTERLCHSLGVNKNELTSELKVNGKEYTLDREALNVYYGKLNNAKIAKIKSQKHTVEMPDGSFNQLSWDKMSDEQRARVLNRTMTHNAEIAKIYIWTQQSGHKFYASDALWQELKSLGITQNVYKGGRGFVE